MTPAVVFDTFPPSSEASDVLAPVPGLAFSLAAVTLGEAPSARLEAARSGGNLTEARLIEIAAEVGLEAAARFLLSILETEATLERCELSPLQYLTEPQLIASAAKLLDVSKIGVCPAAPETELAYPLRPSLSRLFSVSWISKSRARRRPAQITI
ncbi:MAG: hypothetical protein A3G41_09080 [Elusimicrobia bacterium RIFCSPLOWO2_12_FULL_59_9]|nr:MAG: hypothetical protein A3G41_09080 [Elusimicrobia bacterium RIFCSPLOWO2_12_FULL_59_9]